MPNHLFMLFKSSDTSSRLMLFALRLALFREQSESIYLIMDLSNIRTSTAPQMNRMIPTTQGMKATI